jgi:hypothetical protein
MGKAWTPSIVSQGHDETVYLVVDCYGRSGCVWRETSASQTDFETVVADLIAGQYSDPHRVVAFNTAEGWACDASADVAREIRRRCDIADQDAPESLKNFLQLHLVPHRATAPPRPASQGA